MKKKNYKALYENLVNDITLDTSKKADAAIEEANSVLNRRYQASSDMEVLKQLHSMLEIGNGKSVDEPTREEIQKKIKLIVDRIK